MLGALNLPRAMPAYPWLALLLSAWKVQCIGLPLLRKLVQEAPALAMATTTPCHVIARAKGCGSAQCDCACLAGATSQGKHRTPFPEFVEVQMDSSFLPDSAPMSHI